MERNTKVRAAVDCRETARKGVKEITAGNALGGNAGSHGCRVILQSHTRNRAIPAASLFPTCQHQQLKVREAGPLST